MSRKGPRSSSNRAARVGEVTVSVRTRKPAPFFCSCRRATSRRASRARAQEGGPPGVGPGRLTRGPGAAAGARGGDAGPQQGEESRAAERLAGLDAPGQELVARRLLEALLSRQLFQAAPVFPTGRGSRPLNGLA